MYGKVITVAENLDILSVVRWSALCSTCSSVSKMSSSRFLGQKSIALHQLQKARFFAPKYLTGTGESLRFSLLEETQFRPS
jgi:hypothetical protein